MLNLYPHQSVITPALSALYLNSNIKYPIFQFLNQRIMHHLRSEGNTELSQEIHSKKIIIDVYENKTSIYKSQYQQDAYIKLIREMSYFSHSAKDYRYVFSKTLHKPHLSQFHSFGLIFSYFRCFIFGRLTMSVHAQIPSNGPTELLGSQFI